MELSPNLKRTRLLTLIFCKNVTQQRLKIVFSIIIFTTVLLILLSIFEPFYRPGFQLHKFTSKHSALMGNNMRFNDSTITINASISVPNSTIISINYSKFPINMNQIHVVLSNSSRCRNLRDAQSSSSIHLPNENNNRNWFLNGIFNPAPDVCKQLGTAGISLTGGLGNQMYVNRKCFKWQEFW